tara:strand:+ start:510 stop:716 length:207 start_codon:yes stop_codon:yes gene_type:complete
MTYVSPNVKTKRELKDRLAANLPIELFEPGLGSVPTNGTVFIEGPHSPGPHTWYAQGKIINGKLVSVK